MNYWIIDNIYAYIFVTVVEKKSRLERLINTLRTVNRRIHEIKKITKQAARPKATVFSLSLKLISYRVLKHAPLNRARITIITHCRHSLAVGRKARPHYTTGEKHTNVAVY